MQKILFLICFLLTIPVNAYTFKHGISFYDAPKYKQGFNAFDYVELDKLISNQLTQSAFGSYDSFNPFIINGTAPAGIGLTYDTLLKQSADETFSLYGLIADGIDILPDNKGVVFHINKKAVFNDKSPILADDVVFSFNILKEKGLPTYRYYYHDVKEAKALDKQTVLFEFNENNNKELPFILGELPILSKKYWQDKEFNQTTLQKPVSSGPYQIADFAVGRHITYERNPNYWAFDLNVNRGFYYFNNYKYIYYRDTTVAVEAFKAHKTDLRIENEAKKWQHFLKSDLKNSGKIKASKFAHSLPSGMQGFIFNMRKPIFMDKQVRYALSLLFDVNWINKYLFYGMYTPTTSFFDNSYLKAPADKIQKSPVFKTNRNKYEYVMKILNNAGYYVDKRGVLADKKNNPFTFEILIDSANANAWERVILPYIDWLKKVGIFAKIRTVDSMQYNNRLNAFEFDMIIGVWGQSLSPGNEQRYFWHSDTKNQKGSMNYAGVDNNKIDKIIDSLIQSKNKEQLTSYTQSLDELLLNEKFVIPHWYTPFTRVVYWADLDMPKITPMKGIDILTWWKK